mmetsp:Transcript_24464/g.57806  ORF Transcript_24464/g.57806 Transcript_24464/m.57806 type:complete len:236 (+) Transcript_24464:2-709(+)
MQRCRAAAAAFRQVSRSQTAFRTSYQLKNFHSILTLHSFRSFATKTIEVPAMGESISEGTIAGWTKVIGESVAVDEVVCEIATDKVSVEVKSPEAGVIVELCAEEGEDVQVGGKLFVVDSDATATVESPAKEAPQTAAPPAAPPASSPPAQAPPTPESPVQHRVPMIRFRHLKGAAAVPRSSPTFSAEPEVPTERKPLGPNVVMVVADEVPTYFRRVLPTPEECEWIELGGPPQF